MKPDISGDVKERVVSVEHLRQLAKDCRSCSASIGRLPAAVFLNMQASCLLKLIDRGMFIYPKFVGGNEKQSPKRRARKCDLPEWCVPGKLVYWNQSRQNHVIISIRNGKIYLTPGKDYPGFREWCLYDYVGGLKPVELIDDKQEQVHHG